MSRYALQQSYCFNVNNLKISDTNRFGAVDASGNVSSINSVAHPTLNNSMNQGVLVSQPNLIIDHFGPGKHAILFDNNTNENNLIEVETSFTPDWFEEFWIAGAFKSSGSPNKVMVSIGEGAVGSKSVRMQLDSSNKLTLVIGTQNGALKTSRTVSSYDDNVVHSYVLHWMGNDNIDTAKLYVDKQLKTVTTTSSGSFANSSIYSGSLNRNLYFGARHDVSQNAGWNQYLGNMIMNYGSPNLDAIESFLKSST